MREYSPIAKQMPLDIVGSSSFGRDPKIMASRTFNMIIVDEFLVDYAGYEMVLNYNNNGVGRGIFWSTTSNVMITVVYNQIYVTSILGHDQQGRPLYHVAPIGTLKSYYGDVFMDENNTGQIAICDKFSLHIYNYNAGTFTQAILPEGVTPGYVTYQDGRFIIPDINSASWYLSQVGDGLNWFWGPNGEAISGALSTKSDFAQVTLRFPGHGNLLFVMGNSVTELWTDTGGAQFPYQRSSSINFDYGCANPATIATSEKIVAWLAINEKSGPVIMYSTGSDVQQVSTDGINYKLSLLNHPEISCGFFVKISGNLVYHLTFYDPSDNYSLIYDFTTQKFFDVTDEQQNYYIARRAAFFNNDYYFVSLNDGNLYRMNASLYSYNYGSFNNDTPKIWEIPRVRVCSNIRFPNDRLFVVNNATFTIEQGNDNYNIMKNPEYVPRIGLSCSYDGGVSFTGFDTNPIYTTGNRTNKLDWWNLGATNDFVPQFQFWGFGPIRTTNGQIGVYQ